MAWENLREDIAAEFEPFVHRYHEIEEAFEWIRSKRLQAAWETRLLQDGLSVRQRNVRSRTRAALRLAAGSCALCDEKRAPNSRRLCVNHLQGNAKRQREKALEEVAAGRCYALCGRPIRKPGNGAVLRGGRRPVLCEQCVEAMRRRLSGRRRPDQKPKLQARTALRLAAGCCALCDDKRAPNSRRLCVKHLRSKTKREILRRRRKGFEEVAAGRCYARCGRPIRKSSNGSVLRNGRRPVLCAQCLDKVQRRLSKRRADQVATGMCAHACGRPIAPGRAPNGRIRTTCAICAARNKEAVQRSQREKAGKGLCLCGQPTRKQSPTRKRKPVFCEACAAKRRELYQARKEGPLDLLVPAGPARAHLLQLRSLGIGLREMAQVAGVCVDSLRRVLDVTTLYTRVRTAERILELEAVPA